MGREMHLILGWSMCSYLCWLSVLKFGSYVNGFGKGLSERVSVSE